MHRRAARFSTAALLANTRALGCFAALTGSLRRFQPHASPATPAHPSADGEVGGDGGEGYDAPKAVAQVPSAANSTSADMLAAPRSCAIAAQPYQTVAGPGLTLNFDYDAKLFPFQRLPFHHPSVPSMYGHALLDSLAEFAETPRTVERGRNAALVVAPLPTFWRAVGNLNTVYCSVHRPRGGGPGGNGHDAPTPLLHATHPSSGSIELVSSSHRPGLLDVRASLHDNAFQPLCTMLWTGSEAGSVETDGGERMGGGLTKLVTDDAAKREATALHRRPLWPADGEPQARRRAALLPTGQYVTDVRRLDDNKGVAALAHLDMATHADGSAQGTAAAAASLPVAVPPWTVLDLIAEFCNAAAQASLLELDGATSPNDAGLQRGASWTIASYHASHNGDVLFGRPVEIVAAPPKYFQRYSIPPWKHRVGLPMLVGGAPCVVLHAEVRQDHRVVTSGVYYLTLVGA